ncbi:hypothetical protein B296_00035213 [Ensete ventricosum]|uniref:Uncharacterized protein n=1 Tax=Ensete ventricosum TaxID=4639 RepID=A0A426Y1Z2_ENSVE|nr:hypothetical protein B296_00035213 [Ensete ventricosum]
MTDSISRTLIYLRPVVSSSQKWLTGDSASALKYTRNRQSLFIPAKRQQFSQISQLYTVDFVSHLWVLRHRKLCSQPYKKESFFPVYQTPYPKSTRAGNYRVGASLERNSVPKHMVATVPWNRQKSRIIYLSNLKKHVVRSCALGRGRRMQMLSRCTRRSCRRLEDPRFLYPRRCFPRRRQADTYAVFDGPSPPVPDVTWLSASAGPTWLSP